MKSSPTSLSEQVAELALRLKEEDLTALGPLYDLTAARIVRYAQTLTRNRADAEDVLQTTLMRIANTPQRLGLATNPWAYLMKSARNESLQLIRRRRPNPVLPLGADISLPPADKLLHAECQELVRRAVRCLPAEQAEVVVLKTWEEMTFAEIAIVIGESPNTAASRYRYALEKLAHSLRPIAQEVYYV